MVSVFVVLRKCSRVRSGISVVTNVVMVVDLFVSLSLESVVISSLRLKVRVKKSF